jgi:uncharacterized protein
MAHPMINRILVILLFTSSLAVADVASHRRAAAEMLDLVSGQETMKASFNSVITPMLESLKKNGTSDQALADIKRAFSEWMDQEILWDELRPQMVELYVAQFSEPELRELTAFYRSPVGQKALKSLPGLLAEGARIGQAYAKTKEASLNQRLLKVAEKHDLHR